MDEYRGPVHVAGQIGWVPEHGLRGRLKQVPFRSRLLRAWAYLFKYRLACLFHCRSFLPVMLKFTLWPPLPLKIPGESLR